MELTLIEECCHLTYQKGKLKVLLAYPGPARAGLSSLAVHGIYSLINSVDGAACDLIFSDSPSSFFLSLNPREFDIIAFSVTYENHLFEVIRLLNQWGIEPLREKRKGAPIIIGGGIGLYYNPAPFIPILDAVYLGEAEGRLEELIKALTESPSLETLSSFDNVLLTHEYTYTYDGLLTSSIKGPKKKIFRSKLFPVTLTHSCFVLEDTAFKDMFLIELNRGCTERCRFCIASYMGLPYREKEISVVEKAVSIASKYGLRVGLIGAGVTDYSKMEELYRILSKYRVKASFSSLKASSPSAALFEIIRDSNQKTITLAPEAASQELRFAINKKVSDERYFDFAEKALKAGAENIKLYFLIGLPGEKEEDVRAIVEMAKKFRELALPFWKERRTKGEVHLSVNPVIAKPFTPFQWYGLNSKSEIERKLKLISKLVRKVPNLKLSYDSVKDSIVQAIVSRGDTRIGEAAVRVVKEKVNFRRALKEMGLPFTELYTRERDKEELFPWEVVESGISRDYLWREYQNTYLKKPTPACFPGCSACGLCKPGANLQKREPPKSL